MYRKCWYSGKHAFVLKVASVVLDWLFVTLWTIAARLLCPWDSSGKNTGVGCYLLLWRIFLTQESNPGLLHCRQILYQLSYKDPLRLQSYIFTFPHMCLSDFFLNLCLKLWPLPLAFSVLIFKILFLYSYFFSLFYFSLWYFSLSDIYIFSLQNLHGFYFSVLFTPVPRVGRIVYG